MATINLGRVKPVFRGAYAGGTAYVVDDIVTYSNETYICILASTGNLPTDTTYWTKLAAKGTDGTDVGTTLTTQGDILYRDGSGLQRLAAGTSGQVLQTGGAGANPSWGTVSSDYVKLASGTVSSTVSTLNIDGYFSSTYDNYRIIINDLKTTASTSNALYCRFMQGGSQISTSNYHYAFRYSGYDFGGSANNGDGGGASQSAIQLTNDLSSIDDATGHIDMHIHYPLDTNSFKMIKFFNATNYQNNGGILSQRGLGTYTANTTALSGISFFAQGATDISACTWKLYGIK